MDREGGNGDGPVYTGRVRVIGPDDYRLDRSADIDAFWAAQPQTLIHGAPHLGNLFFESSGPGFLDWQIATAGAGIRDIAYFANASVEPDLLRTIERGLVDRYTAGLSAAGVHADADRMWTLYRASITELYLAAVCTAEAGARMQPLEVSRGGVERAVAGAEAHDSFGVLAALIDDKRVRRVGRERPAVDHRRTRSRSARRAAYAPEHRPMRDRVRAHRRDRSMTHSSALDTTRLRRVFSSARAVLRQYVPMLARHGFAHGNRGVTRHGVTSHPRRPAQRSVLLIGPRN
ncbi:phosphotransferase [Nocardia sputi]|uniref:phosphotransferase n=1 Tax=Nocardia sputi TaxID=2943705 RepID=UPI0020BDC444|nr:phosphotransferase [Nocardia sputi]